MSGTLSWTTPILLLSLLSAPALAEQCTKVHHVTKPCTGDLMPTAVSARALKCLKTSKKTCDARLKHANDVAQIRLDSAIKLQRLTVTRADELGRLLSESLKKEPESAVDSFLKSPRLWFGVGLATGVGLALAVAYAVPR